MTESQFAFLKKEFPDEFELASTAERFVSSDPGSAVIYARTCLESGIKWMFQNDRDLSRPEEDALDAFANEPSFRVLADGRILGLVKKIQTAGDRAAQESKSPSQMDAVEMLSALFRFFNWFAFTYGQSTKPDPSEQFDPQKLNDVGRSAPASLKDRQELDNELQQDFEERSRARQRAESTMSPERLEAERATRQAQVARAKKAAASIPVEARHWSEAETRRYKIDVLLAEAGWTDLVEGRDIEYKVDGMPSESGDGKIDFVLWGEDGKPLAVVEAKKAMVDPRKGEQQAKLYADCLEAEKGQRPVVFYTNGFEHWLWDDTRYPARQVQGFYTRDELALLVARRQDRQKLSSLDINMQIAGRDYQRQAIHAIADRFETRKREALVVMATGAGKTRTVIALTDLLMQAAWVKRILFLADRTALVNQAVSAFKTHLPDSAPVNLVTDSHKEGRVYVSTYQTMVGKIDEYQADGTRRFGVGHFDLVIIDEAHRSVYRKFRGIFDYLDSLLVGLTATPKDEVDKNTYGLFGLETGDPTYEYTLEQAIEDRYLVPPRGVSVPLKFVREGIRYDHLTEDEKEAWDELDWGEADSDVPIEPPDAIDSDQINSRLFNEDTVDHVIAHLMTNGIKVAGGDRLGKTIIFAKSQRHADYIKQRFDENYPALGAGSFARAITYNVKYAQSLIDDFATKEKPPHIAISVDMLDTGIDVPEVVNLVFFKPVHSKTKFWQMLGRGTRLCEDLFGPSEDKNSFLVFDFCENLEHFSQPLMSASSSSEIPLREAIFKMRVELLQALDNIEAHGDERSAIAATLRETVASMNEKNFLVRVRLKLVERFRTPEAWTTITGDDLTALNDYVAQLPDQLDSENEEAKRFDLLIFNAQLDLLHHKPFEWERSRIINIASALEDLGNAIPAVAEQKQLIAAIQTDNWWVEINYPTLEAARKQLRNLVQLIEPNRKIPLYSRFADEVGKGTEVELPGIGGNIGGDRFAGFTEKAKNFLKENLTNDIVARVYKGHPISTDDVAELQRLLIDAGIGDMDIIAQASGGKGGFALFCFSLIGLEEAEAEEIFAKFLQPAEYSSDQIEFVREIINHLAKRGSIDESSFYGWPFTEYAPEGPDKLFSDNDLDDIINVTRQLGSEKGTFSDDRDLKEISPSSAHEVTQAPTRDHDTRSSERKTPTPYVY